MANQSHNGGVEMGEDDDIDVVQLVRQQHDRVRELFIRVDDGELRLVHDLLDDIAMHLEVEEAVLYPALVDTPLGPQIRIAAEEHLSVKRIISDLVESDPRDKRFAARITVLRRQVEEHMEDEETEVLPELERELDYDRRLAMAKDMRDFMRALVEHGSEGPLEAVLTDAASPAGL
jgi:hypothetical protein